MGVATAIAVGGLALSAGSTAMSFMQAGAQKTKQRQAEAAAAAAMATARKKLEINYTDELAINKEPYELQREALLSQGALAIQAGIESERGAAATAGRVQMAQNEAQAGVRTAMGAEMTDIENKQIAEQSRLRDLGVQLDLGEVEGAQMAAANAEEAATAHTAQGIQGVIGTAQQGLNMINLYPKSGKNPAESVMPEGGLSSARMVNVNMAKPTATMPNTQQLTNSPFQHQGRSPFQPQFPQPGSQYGMFGANFSGVGY